MSHIHAGGCDDKNQCRRSPGIVPGICFLYGLILSFTSMRSIRNVMLLTGLVMLASMSFATSKAEKGNHSPPSIVFTQHADQIMNASIQVETPVIAMVTSGDAIDVNETATCVYPPSQDQKGGCSIAYGYWKVNRCKNCK